MPNRLADARSPYLLQHKDNPVDWYPWGEEALQVAKQQNKPIFLSVGYAACHWCHVMEHESFENEEIAALLNKHFVCIKVDREERPDIDQIYMNAVQMMTGHGGWPMSVFLTPDRQPFYAGTYWPAEARAGMPGFTQVIEAVSNAWETREEEVLESAGQITDALNKIASGPAADSEAPPAPEVIEAACQRLVSVHDKTWGGFGDAPKFPHVTDLELLMQSWKHSGNDAYLGPVTHTLDKMAEGGIYDHLAGGFARYSVDAQWLVPHFEKMLYDNGGLARLYLHAYQITDEQRFADVAQGTLDYLIRDMTDPAGGFHSSEDADSEGVEGKFYVWAPEEVIEVLGEERGKRFNKIYDVTPTGNFEGHNILHISAPLAATARREGWDVEQTLRELAEDREKLRQHRDKRIHPGRDDKVLTSWNGLAIHALAVGSRVLGRATDAEAAEQAAEFIWSTMRGEDGRLLHAYRDGVAHLIAYLDDYAYTIEAFIALYEATGRADWIERAQTLANQMIEHYEDDAAGGFFYTADDAESLITRTKDWHDSSIPSSNGSAAEGLIRLGRLTNEPSFLAAAKRTLVAGSRVLSEQAAAAGKLLLALDLWHRPEQQVVIASPSPEATAEMMGAYFDQYRPHTTLAIVTGGTPPSDAIAALTANKHPIDGQPTLYVCENYTCDAPLTGQAAVAALTATD
ncbi:MAG: thioredoxin domain-containing protein [Pirellulaceae bacterium]